MIRTIVKSSAAMAILLGVTATASAGTTGEFDNQCAEGLALHMHVKTDCSVNAVIDGKTYCFGNEKAKKVFMLDPKGNLDKAEAYYSTKQ
jgi:YHS domain-containing protein